MLERLTLNQMRVLAILTSTPKPTNRYVIDNMDVAYHTAGKILRGLVGLGLVTVVDRKPNPRGLGRQLYVYGLSSVGHAIGTELLRLNHLMQAVTIPARPGRTPVQIAVLDCGP